MAEKHPAIPEGPATNAVIQHENKVVSEQYEMPVRGTVKVESFGTQKAVYWTTELSTQEAYTYIFDKMADESTVVRSAEKPTGGWGILRFLGRDIVTDIVFSTDQDVGEPRTTLVDLDFWSVQFENGVSFGYIKYPEVVLGEIKMIMPELSNTVPFMRETAIPEIAERAEQYFGNPL